MVKKIVGAQCGCSDKRVMIFGGEPGAEVVLDAGEREDGAVAATEPGGRQRARVALRAAVSGERVGVRVARCA